MQSARALVAVGTRAAVGNLGHAGAGRAVFARAAGNHAARCQAPAPLHTEAVLTDKSPLHEAALHNVPLPG